MVARAIKIKAERQIYILRGNSKNVFILMKLLKKYGKDVYGGRCKRESDKRRSFNEHDNKKN